MEIDNFFFDGIFSVIICNDMIKLVKSKTLTVYRDAGGNELFTNWLNSLRDVQGHKRIRCPVKTAKAGELRRLGGLLLPDKFNVAIADGNDSKPHKRPLKTPLAHPADALAYSV
jgi:hypothetical protein